MTSFNAIYVLEFQDKLVNGGVNFHRFEKLAPGTEYIVAVWAKVVEGKDEILSLSGLANGATSKSKAKASLGSPVPCCCCKHCLLYFPTAHILWRENRRLFKFEREPRR